MQRPAVEAADDEPRPPRRRARAGTATAPPRSAGPETPSVLAGRRGCLGAGPGDHVAAADLAAGTPAAAVRAAVRPRSGASDAPRRPRRASGWPRRRRSPRSTTRAEPSAGPSPVAAQVPTRISAADAELDELVEHGHGARSADPGRLDGQRRPRPPSPRGSPRGRDGGCSSAAGRARAGRSPAPAPGRRRAGRRARSGRLVAGRRARWRTRRYSAGRPRAPLAL